MPISPKPSLGRVGLEAGAVVGDAELDGPVVLDHRDRHAAGAGVLDDVGQRLLHEPVQGALQLGRVARVRAALFVGEIDVELDLQPGRRRGAVDQRAQRGSRCRARRAPPGAAR